MKLATRHLSQRRPVEPFRKRLRWYLRFHQVSVAQLIVQQEKT
jgi:hypothetical protein